VRECSGPAQIDFRPVAPRTAASQGGSPPKRPRRWPAAAAGCGCALLVAEALLRIVATPYGGDPHPWGFTVRQHLEGTASASFAHDGARLTGHRPLAGARTGLIVGDSHVVAYQVEDEQTVGARVEAEVRRRGEPLNVLQYGYLGAAAPTYCLVAGELLSRWRPSWVVVLLNRGDFTPEALESREARFEVGPGNRLAVVQGPPEKSLKRTVLAALTRHSSLLWVFQSRWKWPSLQGLWPDLHGLWPFAGGVETGHARTDQRAEALVARLSVAGLKRAYGKRLLIAYDPQAGFSASARIDALESQLLAACRSEQVRCISLGQALNGAWYARGFHNTSLGRGHYNAVGHRLIAERLVEALANGRDGD
jgi:hypothetical protein